MVIPSILFLAGLGILITGGHFLVQGSTLLARQFRIPEFVIGLTIVALGTSAPELVVNILSTISGSAGIAAGNIIGSNIANILLVLAIGAMIYPIVVEDRRIRYQDTPFLIFLSSIVVLLGADTLFHGGASQMLSRIDGMLLLALFIGYTWYMVRDTQTIHPEQIEVIVSPTLWQRVYAPILTTLGILGLFWGGNMIVGNATTLAHLWGVSEKVIGLTLIAIGTSLPELITVIIASIQRKGNLIMGTIIGSNILNIALITGLTSIIYPLSLSSIALFDVVAMIGATLVLLVFILMGKKYRIERWEGAVLMACYIGYMVYIIGV